MIPVYPVFGVKKKGSGMVVSAFHLSRYPETKIFDHLHICLDAPAPGGEIISAHKGVGPCCKDPGLELLQGLFPAAADGDVFGGINKPEQGNRINSYNVCYTKL